MAIQLLRTRQFTCKRTRFQAGLIMRPNMQVSTRADRQADTVGPTVGPTIGPCKHRIIIKVHASSVAQLLFLKCNKNLI